MLTIDPAPAAAASLSKADEIALLDSVIAQLPAGYLRDILTDLGPEIRSAIRLDFGYVMKQYQTEIADAQTAADDARAQLARLRQESEALLASYHKAQRVIAQADSLRRELRAIVETVRGL